MEEGQKSNQEVPPEQALQAKPAVELKLSELPDSVARKIVDLAGNKPTKLVAIHQSTTTTYQGPIPPPEMLASYDAACPGLADRIVRMAEQNSAHIRSMQSRQLTFKWLEIFVGQIFGLVIALAFLGAGVYLTMNGHPVSGFLSGTTGIATLVGVFIYGRDGIGSRDKKPPQVNSKGNGKGLQAPPYGKRTSHRK